MQVNNIQPNYYNSNNTSFRAKLFVTAEVIDYFDKFTNNSRESASLIKKAGEAIRDLPDRSILVSLSERSSRMLHFNKPQKVSLEVSLGRTTIGDEYIQSSAPVKIKPSEIKSFPEIIYNTAKELLSGVAR